MSTTEESPMRAAAELADMNDKDAVKRDKKGRALAAMGHVARTDEGFEVTTAGRRRETMRVWRDLDGRVKCACAEFGEAEDPKFRCEHILAVKYYLEPPVDEVAPVETAPAAVEPVPTAFVDESEYAEAEVFEPVAVAAASGAGFDAVLDELKQPLPDALVKQRVGWTDRHGREHEVDYVEWHVVADILDRVYPRWSHGVKNLTQIGGLVAVTASITIDGVTREGVGTGEAIDEKGIKKAEHDALKRAAVKFGVARELYRKDSDFGDGSGASSEAKSDDPVARTLSDLITPKQLVAIRAIASASGIDAEKRSLELFNARPEELTKRAASTLIDDLKNNRDSQSARRAS
jgi:hypothetical protein